jgi:hypothetical protein
MTTPLSPRSLSGQTAAAIGSPSDLRSGTVAAVTSRGIDVTVAGGLVQNAAHLSSYNPAVGDPVALMRFQDSWLVLDRPVGPGTPVDLARPGTGVGATILGGTALSGTNTIMATSTGALVPVPRYRCTYHHPLGHHVMIMIGLTWYASVAGDTLEVSVWDAVSALQVGSMVFQQSDNNFFSRFEASAQLIQPTYGGKRVDLYLQVQRLNGTGTSRVDDAAIRRGYMIAVDMADTSVIATV